ncbi:MAG: type I polyketide synthase [Myxococcota bacterium]
MKDVDQRIDRLSPAKRALLALKMKGRADPARSPPQPIAIVGLACRFPGGGDDPAAFWELLRRGTDAITEVPAERYNVDDYYHPTPGTPGKTNSRYGGFISDPGMFDASFFGVSPREAACIDPQQRLLLELCWEALEHAGQPPERLTGSRTGVYVGMSTGDYLHLLRDLSFEHIGGFHAPGTHPSVAAGRIAYTLGFQGPCMMLDTACSSSLTSLHLAVSSLRRGECDQALVAGVNLILHPVSTVIASQMRLMAQDGRCKTFDAAADGYVRGEGGGAVVLKRQADAIAAGDNILALVRGSAMNQDGRSAGLTAPNGSAQEAVIREALHDAATQPGDISYIEAHGTGTALGDPIEMRAIGTVFGPSRPSTEPLVVGSVKTNLGHLEAASGIAGLLKIVLSLMHDEIPAHLHLEQLNPHISIDHIPAIIPTQSRPWPRSSSPRVAGVSSFGFSGTNVHVVVEEAPRPPAATQDLRPSQLLVLSAKNQPALHALAERYAEALADPPGAWPDICFTASVGRSHHRERLALVSRDAAQASVELRAFGEGTHRAPLRTARATSPPKIAFVFAGQGTQRIGVAQALYSSSATFREALDRCDALLKPALGRSIVPMLYPGSEGSEPQALLRQTRYAQPVLFAIEVALVEQWRSWGITPDAVMGHSLGEYVAAYVAGIVDLEEGLRLVVDRGQLMQSVPTHGSMAAVFADEGAIREQLPTDGSVVIAALNAADSHVISGEARALDAAIERLEDQGWFVRRLDVSHAFHSPLMDPILERFEDRLARVSFKPPTMLFVSNETGQAVTPDQTIDAGYWCRQLRRPVRFADGITTLTASGISTFVEIGPGSALIKLAARDATDPAHVWIPSLDEERDDWDTLLDGLAALYCAGAAIDWPALFGERGRRVVPLPGYPFQRQRYWVPLPDNDVQRPPSQRHGPDIAASEDDFVDVLETAPASATEPTALSEDDFVDVLGTTPAPEPTALSEDDFVDVLGTATRPTPAPAAEPTALSEDDFVDVLGMRSPRPISSGTDDHPFLEDDFVEVLDPVLHESREYYRQ